MRNESSWKPSKFIVRAGQLQGSRDARQVSRGSRYMARLQARAYQRLVQDHARGDLLDVGAGAVPLYGVYRDLVSSVTCIDWGDTLHDRGHLDAVVDLSGPIPFEDRCFDTILCTDVIEHLPKPWVLLGECARLLRPGGKLLLAVPFMYWLHEEPHDHHRYTEHRLRGLCEEAGLQVEMLDVLGGGVDVIIDLVAKHLKGSRLASAVWLAAAPALAAAGARLDPKGRSRRRMPLAYTLVATRPSA